MTFGALTASWGSHLFTAASTLDGFTGANPTPVTLKPGWGCDSRRITTWGNPPRWVPACVPDYSLPAAQYPYGGAFKPTPAPYAPTVFDELDAKGLPWRIYGAGVPGGGPDTTAGGYIWSVCPTFAECLYTSQVKNLVPTAQFFTNAAAGTLPAYSVIAPGAGYASDAEHNKQSMAKGDNFLGQVASAMENSPDWGSTIMIITYDDFGGFYANPSPAPGTGPDGTRQGFRLPVVIVSPFARPGYVDTTRASQASITALVEHTFGLAPLGLNDQNAYAYGNALCLPPSCTQAHARPVKMIRRPLPASSRHLGNAGTYADS
jgi:phospholipase C